MKNCLLTNIFFYVFLFNLNAQKKITLELDSLKHDSYISTFVKKLKIKGVEDIIYLSEFNFSRNDTYVIWEVNNEVKSKLIFNKKLKKKIKQKRIKLSEKQKKELRVLLDKDELYYDFLNTVSNCNSPFTHYYFLKIGVGKQNYIINSKCLHDLKQNNNISSLFKLMD